MAKSKKSAVPTSWADLAKKIVYAGLGGASMAHNAVTDPSIPRELINTLLARAEKRKDEIMEILAREVSKFLGKINVSEELTKALKGLVINLHASIDFKDKKGKKGISPTATIHKASVDKMEL